MELYQLRTFVKVADEGNLTRAAEKLFTSQPAISAQIRALEEELGVELFDRGPKGMTLTPQGRQLYERAAETLHAAETLKHQAQALQGEVMGEFRLGINSDYDFLRIGELHQNLRERHEGIALRFVDSNSMAIQPDVRKQSLEGGFYFGACTSADLKTWKLADVPMAIVGPSAWQERIRRAKPEQLAALPWVHTSTDCPFYILARQVFDNWGVEPKSVAYVDNEQGVRELIAAGAGMSLMRDGDAQAMERAGRATRCWYGPLSIELGFAVHRNRIAEPLVRAVTQQITALWKVSGAENESAALSK
ncbi:MAG: LysR family transcriptional regulator [Gammaproteobacteria bacterium]